MERIVFLNNEAHYVDGSQYTHVLKKISTTPMYGIIEINGMHFKCMPANYSNMCLGCHFYDDDYGCVEHDLPCYSTLRLDFNNCIFVKEQQLPSIPLKSSYTSEEIKDYLKIRFKC